MASRKEEKERLRARRLEAERAEAEAGRRRLILGYIVAGLLSAAVLAGLVVVILSGDGDGGDGGDLPEAAHINADVGFTGAPPDDREGTAPPELRQADLEEAADAAGCELRLDLPDEGNGHFTDEDQPQEYGTNPPTSGDHYGDASVGAGAMADGAYAETPPLTRVVHSLEHGRIAIQYSPRLPEEDQLSLKGVFDADPGGMLIFPNPDMPFEVATTAWTQLLGCDRYQGSATLDAIRDFRDEFRGRGPEPVSF